MNAYRRGYQAGYEKAIMDQEWGQLRLENSTRSSRADDPDQPQHAELCHGCGGYRIVDGPAPEVRYDRVQEITLCSC
jgi:hypothetical protein